MLEPLHHKPKRILSTLILPSCLILSLLSYSLGCSKPTHDKQVIIDVQMFEGPEHQAMIPTAQYWNEHYSNQTGIRVEVKSLARIGYFDKLETQLIAGMSKPDIVHPFSIHLGRIKSYLEPLDNYLEDEDIITSPTGKRLGKELLIDAAWSTVRSEDGRTYMIPKDISEVVLYYREDLIPSPPETWDQFIEIAKDFTRSINPSSPTPYGAIVQGKYEMWTFAGALAMLWPYNSDILDPKKITPDINSTGTIKALQIFEQLATSKTIPPQAVNAEYPEVAEIILSGKVPMAMMWNALYPQLLKFNNDNGQSTRWKIAPPPGVRSSDGSISRSMYVQTICLSINKESLHKKQAMRFLVWAALGEGALIYAKNGGSSPVRELWNSDSTRSPFKEIWPWLRDYGRATPVDHNIPALMMIGSGWIQRIIAGDVTAEEAALGLQHELYQQINKPNPSDL